MKKLQPPIKYFGGKNLCFNKIIKYFPENLSYDTYIEPFGGSFALGLKLNPPPLIEIYNDLEQNVYSLYMVLSHPEMFKDFKQKCDLAYFSEDLRKEFKDKLKTELDIVDRAFYFFYVNRTSHNGVGGITINMVIRRNMSKPISDFLSVIDRLPELHQRLSRVIVLNRDGIDLIKKYNSSNVFYYCDPPYHWLTRTSVRYKVDMNDNDHLRFLDAVIRSKSKILISGYDCKIYNVLEQNGFEKINFEVNTIDGNFNKKIKTETLWRNY